MLLAYRISSLVNTVSCCRPRSRPVTRLIACNIRSSTSQAADMASGTSAEELRGQSCSLLGGCSSETPKVPVEQLQQYMSALPAWQLSDDQAAITKSFVAKNFVAAVNFFNRVADVAEAEGHHPDLHLTNYREVKVVLCTHAVGGLTMFDFIMAAKLDAVEVDYSPKWLKQHPQFVGTSTAAQTS